MALLTQATGMMSYRRCDELLIVVISSLSGSTDHRGRETISSTNQNRQKHQAACQSDTERFLGCAVTSELLP